MSNDHASEATFIRQFTASQHYWQTAHGQRQWHAEQACLSQLLGRTGGQHALEMGMAPSLLACSRMRHCISWVPEREYATHPSTLVCRPDALPLDDEALDLVLVHHLLEIAPNPRHLLREAARVTSDSGRLILVGWHPLGIAGPKRLLGRRTRFHQHGDWLTAHRLRDWLGFVDFEIERVDYCGFVPFDNTPEWLAMEAFGRRYNLPLGRAWVICARRQMCRMIPLSSRFNPSTLLTRHHTAMASVSCESLPDQRYDDMLAHIGLAGSKAVAHCATEDTAHTRNGMDRQGIY